MTLLCLCCTGCVPLHCSYQHALCDRAPRAAGATSCQQKQPQEHAPLGALPGPLSTALSSSLKIPWLQRSATSSVLHAAAPGTAARERLPCECSASTHGALKECGLLCRVLPACVTVELQGLPECRALIFQLVNCWALIIHLFEMVWSCLVQPHAAIAAGIPSAAPPCSPSWETQHTPSECMWLSASRSSCPMRPACRRTRRTQSRSRP